MNLLAPGQVYGPRIRAVGLLARRRVIRFGGQRLTVGVDIYNLMNNNVTLGFNQTFVPTTRRDSGRVVAGDDDVHESARLPSERRVHILIKRRA